MAVDALKQTNSTNNEFPHTATVAILLSAISAEAFINDLTYATHKEKIHCNHKELSELGDALNEIEEAKGNTLLKFQIASKILSGKFLDKSKNPYQDFSLLMKIRNEIIHVKRQDHSDESASKFKYPDFVAQLQKRKLAHSPSDNVLVGWWQTLQTKETAEWSCITSQNIVKEIVNMLPTTAPFSLKELFRGWNQFVA